MLRHGWGWWLAVTTSGLVVATNLGAEVEEPRPTVEVRLGSEHVYVGEEPVVRIRITAPADRATPVLKAERVHRRRALQMDLLRHDGSHAPSALLRNRPRESPDDFATLEAGQSVEMKFPVRGWPDRAGDFLVRIRFTPTPDEAFQVMTDLPLPCRELPTASILDRVALMVPISTDPGADRDLVECMNAKTDRGYELLYRHTSKTGVATIIQLERLGPLDEDSRIEAVSKRPDTPQGFMQVWIAYNRGDGLYFARLAPYTGEMLENRALTPTDGELPEGGR